LPWCPGLKRIFEGDKNVCQGTIFEQYLRISFSSLGTRAIIKVRS
jgi:hypothetical protein